MSSDKVPPKVEVMGWNAHTLADYMKRLKLTGCDRVVIKGSITGAQFMKMTESELQKFPTVYVPIITKIHSEIERGEEKSFFGQRSKPPKYPEEDIVQEEEAWDSDEFDKESDYENPDCKEGEDSYICALEPESEPPEDGNSEEASEDDYEMPPSADTEKLPRPLSLTKPLGNDDYIDCVRPLSPPDRTRQCPDQNPQTGAARRSKLAHPPQPKKDRTPQTLLKAPDFHRSEKPKSREGGPFNSTSLSTNKLSQQKGSKPPDHSKRAGKSVPPPPPSLQPANKSVLAQTKVMDPMWYGGQVTRCQAEVALRQLNKDGAFLVRDSSKGSSEQPYTLMVLNQDKVYNIQIRNQGNVYSLGSGINNTTSFPGVKEIIRHHKHNPLQLIDVMDRSSGATRQSYLLHPAGF